MGPATPLTYTATVTLPAPKHDGLDKDTGLDDARFQEEVIRLLLDAQEPRHIPDAWIETHPEKRLEMMVELLENKEKMSPSSSQYWKLLRLIVKLARYSQTMIPRDIQVSVNDFTDGSRIGRGRSSEAYRTTMGEGRRPVVIKFIPSNHSPFTVNRRDYARSIQEKTMPLFHLKHDNILEFIGLTEHRQLGLGIIAPFMEGGNLIEYMDQLEDKDKTFHHRNQWLHGIACGIHYLHGTAQIAHGKIRAANILMDSNGVVKISNFGLAVSPDTLTFGFQHADSIAWTPPEDLWLDPPDRTFRQPTFSGDIYSFAITCIEILEGVVPWDSASPPDAMQILRGERPPIPRIPDNISEELAFALPIWWENDPRRRATSQDVIAFFEHPTVEVQRPEPSVRHHKPSFDLFRLLCRVFPKETTFLESWAIRDFKYEDVYPGSPVHILFDERTFLNCLYGSCEYDFDRVGKLCYPALEIILGRGRRIASRSLFLYRSNTPSQCTHPLVSLGYEPITTPRPGESQPGVSHIHALTDSSTGPATLVVLSGESGWLQDRRFTNCILNLVLTKKWRVEIVAWGNDSPKGSFYTIMTGLENYSLINLSSFFDILLPK